jgi:hypothetical protein
MEMLYKSIPIMSVTVTITSKFPPGGIKVTDTDTIPAVPGLESGGFELRLRSDIV